LLTSYDKFDFDEKYYFFIFHEYINTKLNYFSPISKVLNFWVLHSAKHQYPVVAVGTALYGQHVRARQLQISGASAFHKDVAYTCKIYQTFFWLSYLSAFHGLNYLIKLTSTEIAVQNQMLSNTSLFVFRDKHTRTTVSISYIIVPLFSSSQPTQQSRTRMPFSVHTTYHHSY